MEQVSRQRQEWMEKGNLIHPTALLSPLVEMGTGNQIGAGVILQGRVVLGNDNVIDPYAVIGTPAEFKGKDSLGAVLIGNNNHIGEHVTIHQAIADDAGTSIGNDCYIMSKVHIGHDALIESEVTLSCLSIVGGHSIVMRGANIGLAAVIHQKRVVGNFAMIGMNSTVTKSMPPFLVSMGSPCRSSRVNEVGLKRRGFNDEFIAACDSFMKRMLGGPNLVVPSIAEVEDYIDRWADRVKACGGV